YHTRFSYFTNLTYSCANTYWKSLVTVMESWQIPDWVTFGAVSQSSTAYSRQHSLAPNPPGLIPDSIWDLAMELICLFHSILQSSLKLLFLSSLLSRLLTLNSIASIW